MFFSFFSLPPIDLHLVSKHWAASANLWHWLFLLWPAFQVLLPQSFESVLLNISIQKASLLQSCLFYAASFSLCLSVQMRLGKISLLAALKFSQNIQFAPAHQRVCNRTFCPSIKELLHRRREYHSVCHISNMVWVSSE